MIREVSEPLSTPCDADDTQLYLDSGLLNPCRFGARFRKYPWYPFEDLSFETDEVYVFVENLTQKGCSIFRQTMPCKDMKPKFYEFSSPTKIDAGRLKEWLWLDENIIWADDGTLIINRFSDAVILSWPDSLYKSIFGQLGENLFRESESVFTREDNPAVHAFMNLIRQTWR